MFYLHQKNTIIFFTILIFCNILNARYDVLSMSLNSSEEIKDIFYGSNEKKQLSDENSHVKVPPKIGSFAEGGLIKDFTAHSFSSATQKSSDFLENTHLSIAQQKNVSDKHKFIEHTKNEVLQNGTVKPATSTKLSEMGSNLFLGVPEINHINGTSSIKPRKGVFYNKIVARKGVDTENEEDDSEDYVDSCSSSWTTKNEYFSEIETNDIKCFCCKTNITRTAQESPVNCTKCHTANILFKCTNDCLFVCCKNKLNLDRPSNNSPLLQNSKKQDFTSGVKPVKEFSNESTKDIVFNHYSTSSNLESNKNKVPYIKLKPQITKVPYDVEIVTELLGNSKRAIFVPVTASILIIPLFAMLIFFIWRRIKEYWEKRYYKRMDFLIDGMYND